MGENWKPVFKNEIWPSPYIIHKKPTKLIEFLHIKPETLKPLKESKKEKPIDLCLDNDSGTIIPKA